LMIDRAVVRSSGVNCRWGTTNDERPMTNDDRRSTHYEVRITSHMSRERNL
jgi:hypothetical protein